MKELYCLKISEQFPVDTAWELLEQAGISIAYSEEDDDQQAKLFGYVTSPQVLTDFPWIEAFEPYKLPDINWEEQWQIHGMDYKDGMIHVDLEQFGAVATTLNLEPGPGFGDLSHPTTQLVLKLMAKYLDKHPFIDVGCGSGILTLASLAMGSPIAIGIDIDGEALLHSKKNAEINHMEQKCTFHFPDAFKLPENADYWVIAMNMIHMEQQDAWKSLPSLHQLAGLVLVSGIMCDNREEYLIQTSLWGWQLIEEIEASGWLAFCFSLPHSNK